MVNEVEITAINEVLRTVTLINKKIEEVIELQRQQDLAIFIFVVFLMQKIKTLNAR